MDVKHNKVGSSEKFNWSEEIFFVTRISLNGFDLKQEWLFFAIVYCFLKKIRSKDDKIHIRYPDAMQQCLASIIYNTNEIMFHFSW